MAVGGPCAQIAVVAAVELVVHHLDALHAVRAHDLHRRHQEAEDDAPVVTAVAALRQFAQQFEHLVAPAVGGVTGVVQRVRVELHVARVNDDVNVVTLCQLAQFAIGERRLCRAAAAENGDLAHLVGTQCTQGVAADVGCRQFLRGQHQYAGHVHCHVAVAHHHHALAAEIKGEVALVGARVVPAHEVAGTVAPGQVLAGDSQAAVGAGTHAVDDRVEVLEQVLVLDIGAELDVAAEAEVGVGRDLVEHAGDGLYLGMIGCHPGPHQAKRGGQAVEHLHLHVQVFLRQQVLGRI